MLINTIHFSGNDTSLSDIRNIMQSRKEQYYTVDFTDKNELHIVKYNESAQFKVTEMVEELFKFYNGKIKLNEDIKIKGNNSFTIISNLNDHSLVEKIKTDLNRLLKK
jgi:hypothetical protein